MIKKVSLRALAFVSALAIICGGAAAAWVMYTAASRLPLRQYFPREYTNAVWDWSNPLNKSPADLKRISNFMYLHQLNVVYVDGGQYVAIEKGKLSDEEKQAKRKQLDKAIENYVSTLKKRDIKVFITGGDTDWNNRENWDNPETLLKAAHDYNAKHPDAPLAGVEFDIESYNQEGFVDGSVTVKTLVLTDWLDMVDMLATKTAQYNKQAKHDLEIGFAVPYWFDNQNGNIPSVSWRGKTGPTLYHLLDRLNQLPKSNIVVMAYRNAARGNDGMIYHSRTEVEYAQAKAPNVKVIIGQEVNDVEPAKITFYGQSSTELSSQVKFVAEEFARNKSYGGIAINDLAGFEAMEEAN